MCDAGGMKASPITPLHIRHGADMSNEEGWSMPRHFAGAAEEHRAAHDSAGVFDISHLGKFAVTGNGALRWLEGLLSNSVTHCRDGMGHCTLLLQENGGILDKMLLFRESAGRFFLLGHAAAEETVATWLAAHRPDGPIELHNETRRWSGIGLQGPETEAVMARVLPGVELPPRLGFRRLDFHGEEILLVRASLVGEDGMELFCRADAGIRWYESFLSAGAVPCGMAAREYLRLEHGAVACGRDIGPDKTPIQCAMSRFCDLSKDFIGAEALRRQSRAGTLRRVAAVECEQESPAPHRGDSIIDEVGAPIGSVTSGCLLPHARRGIAMVYLRRNMAYPGTRIRIIIGGRAIPAIVTDRPVV